MRTEATTVADWRAAKQRGERGCVTAEEGHGELVEHAWRFPGDRVVELRPGSRWRLESVPQRQRTIRALTREKDTNRPTRFRTSGLSDITSARESSYLSRVTLITGAIRIYGKFRNFIAATREVRELLLDARRIGFSHALGNTRCTH